MTAFTCSFPVDEMVVECIDNQFDREVEDVVFCFVGGDPARDDAFVLNRISAAMIAIMCGLLKARDTFLSVVPRGRSHQSMEGVARAARVRFAEAYGLDGAANALANKPEPHPTAVTPINLLEKYGIATIPSLGMPVSSPSLRIMLYPDGERFRIDGIVAATEDGSDFLAAHLDDPDAIADRVLGRFVPIGRGMGPPRPSHLERGPAA